MEIESILFQTKKQLFTITTALPNAYTQIKTVNSIIIPVVTKLSIEDPTKCFKLSWQCNENDKAQRSREVLVTIPFEILVSTRMKSNTDQKILTW